MTYFEWIRACLVRDAERTPLPFTPVAAVLKRMKQSEERQWKKGT